MERIRRITRLWNWLPAFRVVAETQNLSASSRELHVSASALSRTIKLLEEELGATLFTREARGLALTPAGERLLLAVRRGMRFVDDGVETMGKEEPSGPFRIAYTELLPSQLLLNIALRMRETAPRITPELSVLPSDGVVRALLDSSIDLAVTESPLAHSSIKTLECGKIALGIYCGSRHPIHESDAPTVDEIASYDFVVFDEQYMDRARALPALKPALRIQGMTTAIEACATGDYLAILPNLAHLMPALRGLRMLPFDLDLAMTISVVFREVLNPENMTSAVADIVREEVRGGLSNKRKSRAQVR